jgi:hypothetical protein
MTKAITVCRVLRNYMRELEQKPEDLIGNDHEGGINEGHLFFECKYNKKSSWMVDLNS